MVPSNYFCYHEFDHIGGLKFSYKDSIKDMVIIMNEVKADPITKYYVNGEGQEELSIGNMISR